MEEFIVWDKHKKCLMGEGEIVFSNYGEIKVKAYPNNLNYINDKTHEYYEENRWEFYKKIPNLRDIENKNIYNDFSIFEFTFIGECLFADFTGKEPSRYEEEKLIGYFTFNDIDLRYEVDILNNSKYICLNYYPEKFKNIKVIDNIQENKLGLYTNK